MGRNSRIGPSEAAKETPLVLPAALVRTLRHPEPTAADFTPTRFCPASTKAWFACHLLRFVSADFPEHQFTQRFYAQLMHTFGHIAHFDRLGFWTEFFTSTRNKVEFLEQTLAYPGYGQPDTTWCDVERLVNRRLRAAALLPLYRDRLRTEARESEQAELVRLLAKYPEHARGLVNPRTVPAQLDPPGPTPGHGTPTQLTLGIP